MKLFLIFFSVLLLVPALSLGFGGLEVAPAIDFNELSLRQETKTVSKMPWSLNLGLEIPINQFSLSPKDAVGERSSGVAVGSEGKGVTYLPSFNPVGRVRASFEHWGFEYSRKLAVEHHNVVAKFGSTDFDSARVHYLFKSLIAEIYYQKYQGLYADLGSDSGEDHILQRPDIGLENFGLQAWTGIPFWGESSANGSANSITAFYGRPESVRASHWSFDALYGANLNHLALVGARPFVPPERAGGLEDSALLSRIVNDSAGLGVGVGATFSPVDRQLVSGMILVGGTVQKSESQSADSLEKSWKTGQYVNARFKWGYYGESHSVAANIILDAWNTEARAAKLFAGHTGFGIDYGYRF